MASLFSKKAEKWIKGRKQWQNKLLQNISPNQDYIWFHCSSLGEFEQGRPLIEQFKIQYPDIKIILTFFSPSGFEIQKNYNLASYVMYLPLDTKTNAQQLISIIKPKLAVFVKYEFWYHYLTCLHKMQIPTIIISAAFRNSQPFFKWYGKFFRKMLLCFNTIFVQDEKSETLLATIGIKENVIVAGDTRYDRVFKIVKNAEKIDIIDSFKGNGKILIAGSTWSSDESLLRKWFVNMPANWKLIIAPHEVHTSHIQQIYKMFEGESVCYSDLKQNANLNNKRVLIIDNIGMLSSIYKYGTIAYIGGGFQKGGIHNILEPAVFGTPVIFGPIFKKFVEARTLAELGLVFSVNDYNELENILNKLISDHNYRLLISTDLNSFIQNNIGATEKISQYILNNNFI